MSAGARRGGARRAATRRPASAAGTVRLEIEPPIALLRLTRPEKLNALTEACREAIQTALALVREDDSVRAVIVTGEGRAFCSGGDLDLLRELREAGDTAGFARILDGQLALTRAIRGLPQIVIAAINGACGGGGLDLALACDIRIASRGATFGAPFLRLGILPDATALALIPRAAGVPAALEFFLDGGFVGSEAARRMGFVSRVVPEALLQTTAREVAATAAARPAPLVAKLKKLLHAGGSAAWTRDTTRAQQLEAFEAPESLRAIRAARPGPRAPRPAARTKRGPTARPTP